MPAKSGKSPLFGKYQNRITKAHEKYKDDAPPVNSFARLPAGIENGIARLEDVKIGTFESGDLKGEPFFSASGVVVEPKEHNGKPVYGMSTRIGPIPLCDTPNRSKKTFEEHFQEMYHELMKLGCDMSAVDPDDLEATFSALKETKPYFAFRTWQGKATKEYPNPRVNEVWEGTKGLEEYEPQDEEAGGMVSDDTGTADEKPEEDEPEDTKETQDEGDQDEGDFLEKLANLVQGCEDGTEQAVDEISEIAIKAGLSADEITAAPSWSALAEMIAQRNGEGPAEEAPPLAVKKGNIYHYTPIDPKTKKPVKKAVEVEAVEVNTKAKTATLKNLLNEKVIYKDVPWDKVTEG